MTRKMTNDEFVNKIKDLVGDEYTFLDEYQGTSVKLRVRHNCKLCNNHIYSVTPNGFISKGNRCNHELCKYKSQSEALKKSIKEGRLKNPIKRKTNEEFVKEIFELVGDEYTFLDEYVKNDVKLRIRHNKCGHIYEVKPVSFTSNKRRCPKCSLKGNKSRGEIFIEKFLIFNNIDYDTQVTFDDCRSDNGKLLKFDFSINYNNNKFLLEFDGAYHKYGWRGNNKSLLQVQRRDMIKNKYCMLSGIQLYRLSSDREFDSDKLLNELNYMFNSSTTIENLQSVELVE